MYLRNVRNIKNKFDNEDTYSIAHTGYILYVLLVDKLSLIILN